MRWSRSAWCGNSWSDPPIGVSWKPTIQNGSPHQSCKPVKLSLFLLPSPTHPVSLVVEPFSSIDLVSWMPLAAFNYRLYIWTVFEITYIGGFQSRPGQIALSLNFYDIKLFTVCMCYVNDHYHSQNLYTDCIVLQSVPCVLQTVLYLLII